MVAWTLLIDPVTRLLDKLIPDPEARAKAQLELLKSEREADFKEIELAIQANKQQTDINAVEATSENLFVAGWRPAIGWTCAAAFAYHFVLQPLLAFILANVGVTVVLPTFDMEILNTVLMGMLGLGSLRTYEKVKGTLPWKG